MCACLPQHPWLFILSSRGHDRQSSDQNFSSRGHDRQSSEQNNRKLISLHNNCEEPIFFCNYSYVVHTEYIYIFFSSTEHCTWAIISPKEFKSWVTRIPLHYCTGQQNYLLSNILRFAQRTKMRWAEFFLRNRTKQKQNAKIYFSLCRRGFKIIK
jgi:hypothetical protein